MMYIFNKPIEKIELKDIEVLINTGIDENQHLDYKEDFTDPKKIAKTVSSFANSEGGIIIFGISEKKDEHGNKVFNIKGTKNIIGNTCVEEFITNSISQNLYPIPRISRPHKIKLPDDKY